MALQQDPLALQQDPLWWWLSFVDTTKSAPRAEQVPGGGGFLGIAIVEVKNIMDAAARAWDLGCNPGGEVQGIPLGYGIAKTSSRYIHRLLTNADIDDWLKG
jgi:hypothetical protein